MDGTGPQRPLGDSQLDRDIESALGIEPSPEFLARARARIAAEPEPSSWRRAYVVFAFRRTSMDPLWGVALVGILMAIVIPQLMRDEPVHPVANTARAVEAGLPASARAGREATRQAARSGRPAPQTVAANERAGLVREQAQQSPVLKRAVVGNRTEILHTVPLQLSPVMFAEEDRLAFAMFVTAAADGRVPEKVVQARGDEEMTPLAIAPLVIAPLPTLARLDRQGEGQW